MKAITKSQALSLFNAAVIVAQADAAMEAGRALVRKLIEGAGFSKAKVPHGAREAIRDAILTATLAAAPQALKADQEAAIASKVRNWISRAHKDLDNTLLMKDGNPMTAKTRKPAGKDKDAPKPAGAATFESAMALVMATAQAALPPSEMKRFQKDAAIMLEYVKAKAVAK